MNPANQSLRDKLPQSHREDPSFFITVKGLPIIHTHSNTPACRDSRGMNNSVKMMLICCKPWDNHVNRKLRSSITRLQIEERRPVSGGWAEESSSLCGGEAKLRADILFYAFFFYRYALRMCHCDTNTKRSLEFKFSRQPQCEPVEIAGLTPVFPSHRS